MTLLLNVSTELIDVGEAWDGSGNLSHGQVFSKKPWKGRSAGRVFNLCLWTEKSKFQMGSESCRLRRMLSSRSEASAIWSFFWVLLSGVAVVGPLRIHGEDRSRSRCGIFASSRLSYAVDDRNPA